MSEWQYRRDNARLDSIPGECEQPGKLYGGLLEEPTQHCPLEEPTQHCSEGCDYSYSTEPYMGSTP